MLYTYTAKNKDEEVYKGELEADSKIDVYARVRNEGGRVLSVREKKTMGGMNVEFHFIGGVNTRDKIIFAKSLSSMLSAGLSLTRALDVMEKQTKKRAMKELIHKLVADVSKGVALSEALLKRKNVFPSIFIAMVRAGEESGNLSESLSVVALQMDKSFTLTRRIRGAMVYPAVILTLMIVIGILLLVYMVPTLTATFKGLGVELPITTRAIIAASDFMTSHTLLAIEILIVLVFGTILFVKGSLGRRIADSLILRVPAIGEIAIELNCARTARTLSSLLSAGVPILDSIDVTSEVVPNHLYKKALKELHAGVQKGEQMSASLSRYERIYPAFVSEMIAVGEETGKISQMLSNVAAYYEDDVDDKTKSLSTIIEPLMMIIIGAGVAVFALSMLTPMYSLVNVIS